MISSLAVRDDWRLPALGNAEINPGLSRRAVSLRWLVALLILAVASFLLILGALRTLGARAHFAATPALFRSAPAEVALRSDRLVVGPSVSKEVSSTRIEQLDDKGLGTKPFTHVVARLGVSLRVPLAGLAATHHQPARMPKPVPAVALPHEILQGSSVPADVTAGATAYAAAGVSTDGGMMLGDAVNSSVIVEQAPAEIPLPRVVMAKAEDTLPKILQALGVAAADVDAISSSLVPKGWFSPKRFFGGEKITVTVDHSATSRQGVVLPLKVGLERPGKPESAVARADDGKFVPVAAPAASKPKSGASPDSRAPLRPALDESLRDSLYAIVQTSGVDRTVVDAMVRLFGRDIDLNTPISGNDTVELLYSTNDLGEPELAFVTLTLDGHAHRYYRFTAPDDGSTDYYDVDGHSVTQSLLRKPVAAGELGDGYGWRMHPVLGVRRLHQGVDYRAPFGSPVVAAGAGVVELISEEVGYGKYIRMRHDLGYETTYAHVSGFAHDLHVGSRVRQGETIAYVGSTGYSTGPHLYYEVHVNGRNVDPLRVRLRDGRVLDGNVLAAFQSERDRADLLLKASAAPSGGG